MIALLPIITWPDLSREIRILDIVMGALPGRTVFGPIAKPRGLAVKA